MAVTGDDLRDLVIVVTGAGSGIARATAIMAAQRGGRVAVLDIQDAAGQAVVDRIIEAEGEATYHHCDVTKGAEVTATFEAVLKRYGRIDVLVNVVGGSTMRNFWEMSEADWDREITFNLKSQFLCCRAVVPHMMARRSGAIVNLSSGQGAFPAPQRSGYSAAKAGVVGFTRTLAAEMAPYRVRVNAVAPSATNTERARSIFTDEAWQVHVAGQPLGRVAEPEDQAESILFLASPRARHITGQVHFVNGGSFMP